MGFKLLWKIDPRQVRTGNQVRGDDFLRVLIFRELRQRFRIAQRGGGHPLQGHYGGMIACRELFEVKLDGFTVFLFVEANPCLPAEAGCRQAD